MAGEQSDGQEKQEAPTPRRLTQAHEDGRVARSQELGTAVVVLAGATALATFAGTSLGQGSLRTLTQTGQWLTASPMGVDAAALLLRDLGRGLLLALLPFFLAILTPALVVNGLQARGVLSTKPITPSWDRVSPLAGLKRLLSLQSLFTLVKAIVKLLVIGLLAWLALSAAWPLVTTLTGAEAGTVIGVARSTMVNLVLLVGLAFLGVAGVDYAFMAWRHQQDLRMSRQEIIQEHRELEGQPMVKQRLRSLAQTLARRRMLNGVREADVVIVNPTEIAVALRYHAGTDQAPVVVAMGRRKLAEQIRALASKAGVPILRNVPVARALIATATVGQPIPPALYAAVAEVLAFVYRERGGPVADRATG